MNLALTQASLLDRRLQNVITPLCGPVWVFERGGFSPSGAEIYIRGVLLALHQRVKPAKCCKQENMQDFNFFFPCQASKASTTNSFREKAASLSQGDAELRRVTMGVAGPGWGCGWPWGMSLISIPRR
ncbi:uncharacterized protein LOC135303832 isoform X2 [Passer domesticus]|uniref:uncharacterized protein LOC135303832 isoform X2 n=1 Tax=Passer domesticus TaxID=48849 RepID=UPI0030FEBD77